MRVLLSTTGLRGDVEPVVALAVRLRELGTDVRVCAPPDTGERLAEFAVPFVPVGQSLRVMMQGMTEGPEPRRPADELAEQFDAVPAAAEGCDVVLATGVLSAAIGVRSVAESLGIPYFYAAYCPIYLPSPYYPPPLSRGDGRPPEEAMDDNRALWDFYNEVFSRRYSDALNGRRAVLGLPPVENLVQYGFTEQPWMAADPVLAPPRPELGAVQTGAWILPDERPLPADLEAFLATGPPPVYVGFGSTPEIADTVKLAVESIRAKGHRVVLSRGWADMALPDDGADCFAVGEVNLQALFGRVAAVVHHAGGGTTTVAARAGIPQVVLPQITDQPYFAEQVAALGIGVAFEEFGPAPTFASLSAALATALSPEIRARAKAVAGTLRTDGTTVAAERLRAAVGRVSV
ncbi:vancomycin aglycone glucosyltransferase [Amycolatopsis lurida]|uniref:Glycosyl transferase n=1 Tax=Amycolatopsis lurida NRRL 2430 TaxID=1460371 RepID=A0A2P2FRL1_AMYLU|nr:glycosyltransferase [Amycolatopsis lurida]KFU79339.1 glycosyl transferase [Amycolatopsis lurida NRRL 2430]SED09202.1 vancomycin aglycone glucosyltransferase [Amycolatopsis lurida]